MTDVIAKVRLWGTQVGAVYWDQKESVGAFEYTPEFLNAPVEISPLEMQKRKGVFRFRGTNRETYYGLPGMLADSLPDKFGNALIDQWCKINNKPSLNPVERLLYIGSRGMGALEYSPALREIPEQDHSLDLNNLVDLANKILRQREDFSTTLLNEGNSNNHDALTDILQVGTSAGGARAKAVIAWNRQTGDVRSGQLDLPEGYEHYLLKFDGVDENRDKGTLADPKGYGRLEYAYHLMAVDAGITMEPCELLKENGRAHFLTRRFDRNSSGKLHMQTLCGLAHFDYNMPGAYGYEQVFQVISKLLGKEAQPALEEMYRRMIFNVFARNQDDHTKNISFLMDRSGHWQLAPAYDVVYANEPDNRWMNGHQITINGKRGIAGLDELTKEDLLAAATKANLTTSRANRIITSVKDAVNEFQLYADKANVSETLKRKTYNGLMDRKELLSK